VSNKVVGTQRTREAWQITTAACERAQGWLQRVRGTADMWAESTGEVEVLERVCEGTGEAGCLRSDPSRRLL
jgi:hypothetical protein